MQTRKATEESSKTKNESPIELQSIQMKIACVYRAIDLTTFFLGRERKKAAPSYVLNR